MTNPIAVVEGADSESIQRLFGAVAVNFRARGVGVIGVTAEMHDLPDRSCSAGLLRNVASNERFSIYLETQPAHTSCHLDAKGVEEACASVLSGIPECELVVLSKFGKLEAAGGGLFPAFGRTIAAGLPLLTSVSGKHQEAWRSLAPEAEYIEATEAGVDAWWRSLVSS